MYLELPPSPNAKNKIDTFWVYESQRQSKAFKVLPDGCVDIIFDLNQDKGFFSSIMTEYQIKSLSKNAKLFGIRFKVEDFATMTTIPLWETKNQRIELSHLIPDWNPNITQRIQDFKSLEETINYLEKLILAKQYKAKDIVDPLVLKVVHEIRKSKGKLNIKALAQSHFISIRQLERRFKKLIGVNLKEFSNIIRFKNTKKLISNFPQKSLLEIAFDMGYYDHAHLNNDFKRIAGENPSTFR